jgi:hypothetical protein
MKDTIQLIIIWAGTITGVVLNALPFVQFTSAVLATCLSISLLYKHFKKK